MKLQTKKFNVKAVKTDLDEDVLRLIYNFLISFFIGMLKRVKPSDLKRFISNNTTFDIRPLLKKIPAHLLPRITQIVRNNQALLNNFINGEKLISKAKEKRPDLYQVLITPKGRIWTERLISYIKKTILTL